MHFWDQSITRSIAVAGLILSGSIQASGTATFEASDEKNRTSTITLEYLNDSKIRMDVPGQQGDSGHMIMRDNKIYMVSETSNGTMVMDLAQIGSMASSFGGDMSNDTFKNELINYKKLGRTETVAGYKGDVYSLTWRDNKGTHTQDAVLSSDSSVLGFTRAWQNLTEAMARAMGKNSDTDNSMWDFLRNENKGILRLGKQFRLASVNNNSVDPFRFVLPAEPMEMPGMGSFGGTTSTNQNQNQDQNQNSGWGSIFGQKAEQHSERQQNRVERKADYATDRAIDKAVDGALKGIFGW